MAQELKVLLTYPFCFLWEGACAVGEAMQRAHLGISMLRVEGETMLEKARNCRLMFLFQKRLRKSLSHKQNPLLSFAGLCCAVLLKAVTPQNDILRLILDLNLCSRDQNLVLEIIWYIFSKVQILLEYNKHLPIYGIQQI